MTRFTASSLDLSNLSTANLFAPISFASIRAARIADLTARLQANNWPYNVAELESDPGVYLNETGAYRETLNQQAINDSVKSVLLAFAQGPYLDRLGDLQMTARMVGEQDDRYRQRIQLAPEAFSTAGSAGSYVYWGMGADLRAADIGVAVLNRGTPEVNVEVTVLSNETSQPAIGIPTQDLINAVWNQLYRRDIKVLTDSVSVVPAVPSFYSINAIINILPGPDPSVVLTNALISVLNAVCPVSQSLIILNSILSIATSGFGPQWNLSILNSAITGLQASAGSESTSNYWRLALGVPRNAIIAALAVPGADSVTLLAPTADVPTLRYQFGSLTTINLTTNIINFPIQRTEVGPF